jgi:hypothetical protein
MREEPEMALPSLNQTLIHDSKKTWADPLCRDGQYHSIETSFFYHAAGKNYCGKLI